MSTAGERCVASVVGAIAQYIEANDGYSEEILGDGQQVILGATMKDPDSGQTIPLSITVGVTP